MAVQIPGNAVGREAANNDIEAPTVELLRSLSLLPIKGETAGPLTAITGPPDSVAIIEAGATAATKWWSAAIAAGGAAVVARLTSMWNSLSSNSWNQPFALIALGIVFAATAAGIAYLLGSDVRGRAAAMVATVQARQAIASKVLDEASRAVNTLQPTPVPLSGTASGSPSVTHAEMMFAPVPALDVEHVRMDGADENGWRAVALRARQDDPGRVDFFVIEDRRGEWVASTDLKFV